MTERFGQASVLFAVDQFVKGVLSATTGLIRGILSMPPMAGIRQLVGILRATAALIVYLIPDEPGRHGVRYIDTAGQTVLGRAILEVE